MLTRMRKILIVISILFLLLATSVGGAYLYVQHLLSQLPVENLNYRIAGIGYKHIRLAEVNFTYIEPSRNVDALSSGFQSGETALQAPVQLNDVFVTWQWQGFSPNLQIIEVGRLDFTLSQWPVHLQQDEDAATGDWRLPEDWRIPGDLPHQLEIKEFIVDLPCADRCYYSGRVQFSSENKARLLTEDEPQRTQLTLVASPHQRFHELEQLNIYVDYQVVNDLPELGIVVQSPMALNLQWKQNIDRVNALHGELALQLEPSAHWIFDQLWQWWPQLEADSEPLFGLFSDTLTLDVAYHSELPDVSVDRWLNEMNAEIAAEIALQDQFLLSLQSEVQRDDTISFDGRMDATLLPGLQSNLLPLLAPLEAAHDSSQNNGDGPSKFTPAAILAQVDSPVTLRTTWGLQFPPGTEISSWPGQADGTINAELNSQNSLNFEHFSLMELASQVELELAAGIVSELDFIVSGGFDLLSFSDQLDNFTLDPDRVHWSIHIDTDQFINWNELPVQVHAQSTGSSDITLDARLFADVKSYLDDPTANGLDSISLRSERGQILMRQPQLQIDDIKAENVALDMPFTLSFSGGDGLRLQAANAAQLQMGLSMPFNDTLLETSLFELTLTDWGWHMPLTGIADSQFTSQLDIHAASLQAPALQSINWRWFGSVAATPLGEQAELHANGRLTNSAGLVLRQQLSGSAEQITVDWQLADIFWLAGNPIAGTLDDLWPELLTLERGRTRAAGQLHIPFNSSAFEVTAELELLDVAGIYDTASFSGLRAQFNGHSDGENFVVDLQEGYIQRLQYGMTHGPGDIQLSYRGAVSAPLAGELEIKNNRLSVLNGVISLLPASYDLSQPEHTFYVDISQLDIARLLAEYPAADIQGSGLLSGNIPVRYSPQGIFVERGQISALPPGGQLQYRSERARQMAQSNMAMGIVMDALDDFHYSELQGDVTYLEDGTLQIGLLIEGRNPKLEQGRPVRLNITLEEDLPALLTSLQLTNQLNEVIQERIQQRLIQGLRN